MEKVQKFNAKVRASLSRPTLRTGDIVRVHRKIKEGDKERIQIFEGIVIGIKGKQSSSPTVTVRRVSYGTGVEITIPVFSPTISKIEIIKQTKVRRSKLYYLRHKGIRISKLKTKELGKFAAKEEKESEKETDHLQGETKTTGEDKSEKESEKSKENKNKK